MRRFAPLLMLLLSCERGPDFALGGAQEITLTGPERQVRLDEADLAALGAALAETRLREVEVYSKPTYTLTWSADGATHTASFFTEERLAYPGDYTDAWSERMSGGASSGAKLTADTLSELERLLRE